MRVGDVDDDLAGEALTPMLEDSADCREGNGEDDDVADDRLVRVGLADQFGAVAALLTTPAIA